MNPRFWAVYSSASSSSSAVTSSTGSSRAEASVVSETGSSMTMSTASTAARAPPGKSLMSKATCSWAVSRAASSSGTAGPSGLSIALLSSRVRFLVELLPHVHLTGVGTVPAYVELPQRLLLLQDDERLPVQLEQREEPGHDDQRGVGVRDEVAERGPVVPAEPVDDERGLLPHRHLRRVQVVQPDLRRGLGDH